MTPTDLISSVLQETNGNKDQALVLMARRQLALASCTSSGFARAKPDPRRLMKAELDLDDQEPVL